MQTFRDFVLRTLATSTQRKITTKRNLEQDHGEMEKVSEAKDEIADTLRTRQQQALAEAISTAL